MPKVLKRLACPTHKFYFAEVTIAFDAVMYCPTCGERLEQVSAV